MTQSTGPRGVVIIGTVTVGITLCMIVAGLAILFTEKVHGAELPDVIKCGTSVCDGDVSGFGRYSDRYYARRWKRMCNGSARYAAMREAYEMHKPQPCK